MKKIAIIFDFDETLVEESTTTFLENLGINTNWFWKESVQKLLDADWDPIPAYMYKMIEFSLNNNSAITKQSFVDFAKTIKYKPGVKKFFSSIKKKINEIDNSFEIQFYIISSGIGEIIRNTEIAKEFNDIWASDFAYNPKNNEIVFPKRVLSFTDKTRYIFQISKGFTGKKYRGKPYIVNTKIENKDYAVPIKNMIYIGDGMTDIPCFSLLKSYNGTPIAVYDAQNTQALGKAWSFIKDERVSNLHSANFNENSDLYNSILMAVNEIINSED